MTQLAYLALLAGCLAVTGVLEVVLRVRVYARWRRLVGTLLIVGSAFLAWDFYAVVDGQWSYNRRFVLGALLPSGLPVEEVAFFVVIPICAIATLEAVRRRRPHWLIGDERSEPRR